MAWLELTWKLDILDSNERGDNPELQFVLVTVRNGRAALHGHRTFGLRRLRASPGAGTGVITSPRDRYWGRIRSQPSVPDADNPYFGFVVRAIERDNSGSNQRSDDYEAYLNAVTVMAQEAVEYGGAPGNTMLWMAGRSVALTDVRGDDDDRIGVSARADRFWARADRHAYDREASSPNGRAIGLRVDEELGLTGEGAGRYQLTVNSKLRAGAPNNGAHYAT